MSNLIFFVTGLALGIIIWRALTHKEITININHTNKTIPTLDAQSVDMHKVMEGIDEEDDTYENMGNTIKGIKEEVASVFGGSDRE